MAEFLESQNLPPSFAGENELVEFMTRPSKELAADLAEVDGDLMILGVGGKMGPTLARLAKRAAPDKEVIGVARFSEPGLQEHLQSSGIYCIKADLLDREALTALPKPDNIIFMAGRKFGSAGVEDLTWAMNVHCPALVAEAFKDQRIVSFSTACVYPFVPVDGGGATEDLAPNPPGEYAQSCVGRERMFQYFSKLYGTPGCIVRLSYAIDTRYGVLYDIADSVLNGRALDITTGYANVIWQGDANSQVLRALRHCDTPAWPLNVSGPTVTSIRWLAGEFGHRFGKKPKFTGCEADTAWILDTSRSVELFGEPLVPMDKMIDWMAHWILEDGASLGKPTHFEARDGAY